MNWRQSAKAAEQVIHGLEEQIADLMFYKKAATQDIKDYNNCILSMISGGSPCEWCEDQSDCKKAGKAASTGCQDWLLAFHNKPDTQEDNEEHEPIQIDSIGGADESERILPSGQKG